MAARSVSEFEHFLDAQVGIFDRAVAELRAGAKRSHWMWFVFPQISGISKSEMSARFALPDLASASRYAEHVLLGARLREAVGAAIVGYEIAGSAAALFGEPDDNKFHASMTLFAAASGDDVLYQKALSVLFDGEPHKLTVDRIKERGN